jgi:FHS family Na+ dependent glucose MFS transporter 1
MNALHFFFGVGALVSPIVVAQALARSEDIAAAYWILGALLVPAAIWLARLPSPPIESADAGAETRHSRPLVVGLAACFFLGVGGEVAFGGWIYTYAITLDLADGTGAAYLTSVFWASFTLGRLIAIPLSARIGPLRILAFNLAGGALSVALILCWPGSSAVLWLGAAGVGMSIAPVFASLLTLAERHMAITGRVTGWFFVGSSAGAMFLPWLVGQFFESVGPIVTMGIILVDLIVALALLAALILFMRRRVHSA